MAAELWSLKNSLAEMAPRDTRMRNMAACRSTLAEIRYLKSLPENGPFEGHRAIMLYVYNVCFSNRFRMLDGFELAVRSVSFGWL